MRAVSHADLIREPAADGRDEGALTGAQRRKSALTLVGLVLVLNSFAVSRVFEGTDEVAAVSGCLGALILAFPIQWTALRDVRGGTVNTNVLVALAVLALFGSSHYPEAGIVAFLMQVGQMIETRTAQGALASIQALVRITTVRTLNGPKTG